MSICVNIHVAQSNEFPIREMENYTGQTLLQHGSRQQLKISAMAMNI